MLLRLVVLAALLPGAAAAQTPPASPSPSPSSAAAAPRQTDADEYTRYELLGPGTGKFRILYEVTATAPGSAVYYNPIRKGSAASEERVRDRLTGRLLDFSIVGGKEARDGGLTDADPDERYIAVRLPRPVPADGEVRLLIEKTYQDPKSYMVEAQDIVFTRSLGIKRNAVVLPAGYELVGCNVPAQVLTEADGRMVVSFMNTFPGEAGVVIRGRPLR